MLSGVIDLVSLVFQLIKILQPASFLVYILGCISFLLLIYAAPTKAPFPNLPFHIFSNMIQNTFHPDISLATVLVLLFTLTENTDLINMHACQQHPHLEGEKKASGWLLILAHILCAKFDEITQDTFYTCSTTPCAI